VLEIHIDVGRLAPLLAHEPLEEKPLAHGIDRRDAEHVADGRVRRRAAALAQDALRTRKTQDRLDRQEIRRIAQLLDEIELMPYLR
jgi:hypothetical protein